MATSGVSPPDPEQDTEDANLPDPSRNALIWASAFLAACSDDNGGTISNALLEHSVRHRERIASDGYGTRIGCLPNGPL